MSDDEDASVQWDRCILCQKDVKDKLINPAKTGTGYDLLARNLHEFYRLNELPFDLSPYLLSNINSLQSLFIEKQAVWHKKCYVACHNLKLQRARLRAEKKAQSSEASKSSTADIKTRSSCSTKYDKNACIFCELPGTQSNPLHQVMQKSCNDKIIKYATVLQMYELLAKVSKTCDLIALEAKYHKTCMTDLDNKRRSYSNQTSERMLKVEDITFADLVTYINNVKKEHTDSNPIFNVTDLAKQQSEAMKELGFEYKVNATKLKEKLLKECPDLVSCDEPGKSSLLIVKDNVNKIVRSEAAREYCEESSLFCRVAENIRSDIFSSENGLAPPSLISLLHLILYGSAISREEDKLSQNLGELIVYHAIKKSQKHSTGGRRHNKCQEKSVPVYLAAKLYVATRKKKIINRTHKLGFSISYGRLQSIITKKYNSVCEIYHKEKIVCPPQLKKNLFTTAAVDNVDHNPSSTTASTAFHGTAITLMQHKMLHQTGDRLFNCEIDDSVSQDQEDSLTSVDENRTILPTYYSIVPPCFVDIKKSTCSPSEIYTHSKENILSCPFNEEKHWLESTTSDDFKPWAAYHAQSDKNTNELHSTNTALLPIFKEQAHNTAMMLHTMDIVEKAVKLIDPNQTPVIVADQPLYALLKQLQYSLPARHGESKLFVMMGGLHIEMAILKVIGQLLADSGWVEALVEANVTTKGRSEAMLSASHVTRTRHVHQVTAAVLYALQKQAFESEYPETTFEEWRLQKIASIPQFRYWDMIFQLELLLLQFVKSNRKGDFKLYLDSLRSILPWFFSLDHVNYARWLSVHLRDLSNLPRMHPNLLQRFEEGLFVARKTKRQFSGMALDQAHEQMNALLKGDGGMIGLTENPEALRKWLVAGPELAAMVDEFEKEMFDIDHTENEEIIDHRSDTQANKEKFILHVKSLKAAIQEMGNPFCEKSSDLFNIYSMKVASPEVIDTIMNIEANGETQYQNFCVERLQNLEKSLHDPIKLNRYKLFSSKNKSESKFKSKLTGLKNDCSLFSKLFIATSAHREADLDNFFAHENQPCPPSISDNGSLRSVSKSDLVKCLIGLSNEVIANETPRVSAKILDGSAVVHFLKPSQCKSFGEYADTVFSSYLRRELSDSSRLDVVWDRYNSNSLKNMTREKRGTGERTRVNSNTKIPKKWEQFLKDSDNKEELFHLLSDHCHSLKLDADKELNLTDGSLVLSSSQRSKAALEPSNHEEADTRIFVHLADIVSQGHTTVLIRSVDTDVLILAISCIPKYPDVQLWVHLGTGKHHQFLSCNEIANALGTAKAKVLPVFHAFTGCDTVSGFNGKGKKTAFEAWNAYPDATKGFEMLIEGKIDEAFPIIEKFVITMYDRSSDIIKINHCRRELFTKKDRRIENIPPTEDALYQHMLRAMYQGVHIWCQLTTPKQDIPDPQEWGWTKSSNNLWVPTWATKPVASQACLELIKCKCKKNCTSRCKCRKENLKCTELCLCDGKCQ